MTREWIDPKKQFSKRLARWTAIFWFAYMSWLSVLILLAPAAAQFAVYMAIIVTTVMILNVWAYTKNSIYEKSVLAMLDKTSIELGMKKKQQDLTVDEDGGDSNG